MKFLYKDYNILGYGRFSRDEHIAVVINNRNEKINVEIPVWELGISRIRETHMTRVFMTNAISYTSEPVTYPVTAGVLTLQLDPLCGIVLYHREEK